MIGFVYRIFTIGRVTLLEAVRSRVLNVLWVVGLVFIACSVVASQMATPDLDTSGLFDAQIKFVKDFGCGAIGFFGFFITLLSTAQIIPQELDKRTIYTILAKPVRRAEFILGKFIGIVMLLTLVTAIMSLAFAATVYWQEVRGISATEATYNANPKWRQDPGAVTGYNHEVENILKQTRDPQIVEAILLVFAKLVMTTAIALFISTFSTSAIFTIVTTFLIYLIGHLESTARDYWLARGAESSIFQSALVGFISMLIPDMNSFTIVDEILAGNTVPWHATLSLLGYADIYVLVLLAGSVVVFDYREL